MPRVMRNMRQHDFYCLNCGNRNYTLLRQFGRLREKWHRKVLYCPVCKVNINHIECRNDSEAEEFKQAFKEGTFIEEAEDSIRKCKENNYE